MSFAAPLAPADIEKSTHKEIEGNIRELVRDSGAIRQIDGGDAERTAHNLAALLGRVSGTSTREIDGLIGELRTLRERLQADGERIQREIEDYATLSQSVMQVTKIISESVKKLPEPRKTFG